MNVMFQRPRKPDTEMFGIGTWPSAMDCEIEFDCRVCQSPVRTRSRIKAKKGRCYECQARVNQAGQVKAAAKRRAQRRAAKG